MEFQINDIVMYNGLIGVIINIPDDINLFFYRVKFNNYIDYLYENELTLVEKYSIIDIDSMIDELIEKL